MSAQVERIELVNTLDLVEGGIAAILLAWNEGEHTTDPHLLLDALTQLECARGTLARLVEATDAGPGNANGSAVLPTAGKTSDDEPSAANGTRTAG